MILRDIAPAEATGLPPGTEIFPGYEVVRLMRRGGRLDTYDVYSRERDCRCVLKVVREDRAHELTCRRDVLVEGRLLRELTHPHLVRAYEVIDEARPAVVLETLTGATLAALIEDAALEPADAAQLGLQLASVLGYLHRHRWLHLDVKPSNVVVQAGRAVLIDLSLVARPGDGRAGAGTDGYLSPEQARGTDLSAACDVFGLGVTLGEAVTNRLPYGQQRTRAGVFSAARPARGFLRRLNRGPEAFGCLVRACIDPDPARRPDLAAVKATLTSVVQDAPHEARKTSGPGDRRR